MARILPENENSDVWLSLTKKIDTKDPETTKWQPLEAGEK